MSLNDALMIENVLLCTQSTPVSSQLAVADTVGKCQPGSSAC